MGDGSYDVFLSYSRADLDAVRRCVRASEKLESAHFWTAMPSPRVNLGNPGSNSVLRPAGRLWCFVNRRRRLTPTMFH